MNLVECEEEILEGKLKGIAVLGGYCVVALGRACKERSLDELRTAVVCQALKSIHMIGLNTAKIENRRAMENNK